MNINAVNNQVFHGLWSKTKDKNGNQKYAYYPFFDENASQINNAKQEVEKKGIFASMITVMAALPFTAGEYLTHPKSKLTIMKQRLIDKHVIDKKLSAIM